MTAVLCAIGGIVLGVGGVIGVIVGAARHRLRHTAAWVESGEDARK